MLVVEAASAILNLITGVPEVYFRSVEILTAVYREVDIGLLALAFMDPEFPKYHCRLSFSFVI
jgi:hypothetical protein